MRETSPAGSFGGLLKQWRQVRNLSQMALSLDADVSSRHISFLETGRTQPSRDMVLHIGSVLDLPLRDRNTLLVAAGFAPFYRETGLDVAEMDAVRRALDRILDHHAPYPAIVLDGGWNFVTTNAGAQKLLQLVFPSMDPPPFANALHLLFSPDGLQPYVDNWKEVASMLLARVQRECAMRPQEAATLLDELTSYPGIPDNWQLHAAKLTGAPVLELVLEVGGRKLRFFTMLTTFGTPQDVTLQELRIECYFPSDDATRRLFAS